MKKPIVLTIMDGFGINPETNGNAIYTAKTPRLDKIFAECPNTQIGASGMDVGLPDGQMGNSEVGHTNIGAGRIVYQELTRITKSIADGDFFNNEAFLKAIDNCKNNDSALHLMGLLSDGGVHSHIEHLYGLLELAKKNGLNRVYVHALLDGRDVPPASAADTRLSAAVWGSTHETAMSSISESSTMEESPSEQMMMRSPASTSIVKWSAYMLGSEPSARVIMERLGCRRASPTVISPASTSSST